MKPNAFWVLIFLSTLFACSQKKESLNPVYKTITHSVYASGLVRAANQYQVFVKTAGIIEEVLVAEGEEVQKGQALLTISNNAARFSRDNSLEAARYNAEANNRDRLEELKVTLEVLAEKQQNDSLLYVRQQNLWNQNVGTQLELEQKELNWNNSKAAYVSAMRRYTQLQKQISYASKQSKLNLEISNSQLGDLTVRSEIQGIVYDVFRKKGEMVNQQTPVAVIGAKENFYLELQVDEYDIAKLTPGMTLFVTMDSQKGKVFEARLSKLHPLMNEKSKTFLVEAEFVKIPEHLYPNLTVEANIVITRKEKALLIPRNYLLNDSTVLMENGEQRKIKTGLMDYTHVEILEGLSNTDALIKP